MKPLLKQFNLSPISKSTREEYIHTNALSTDEDQFTDIIDPPYSIEGLKNLRYSSIYHRKCIKAKAVDVARNGYKLNNLIDDASTNNEEVLKKVFDNHDNIEAIFRCMEDYYTFTHACMEILQNTESFFRGFKHIRANTIRMCKGGEHALQVVGSNKVYYKVAGAVGEHQKKGQDLDYTNGVWGVAGEDFPIENKATSIIWLNGAGMDSDYYHEPEYLPALLTILSDEYLREYNNNHFITGGIPNYLITITGNFDEGDIDETTNKSAFEESFETAFQNLNNQPGSAIVFTIPTNDPTNNIDVNIEKVSDDMKEASFEKFRESNRDEILAAHEVPPSRLGITINGSLGGSVDVERNRKYNDYVIKPDQLRLENIINKLIVKGIMQITDWEFNFKTMDVREVKEDLANAKELFLMGAMKPSQIYENFKEIFKLEDLEFIPQELDEFYIQNQPVSIPDISSDAGMVLDTIDKKLNGYPDRR